MNSYESEKIDFEETQLEDYSGYFLTANPLVSIPVPEEVPTIFIDRTKVRDAIRDAVKRAADQDVSVSVLVEGAYGSGKSHLLKVFHSEINRVFPLRSSRRGIASYVTPGKRFTEFYTNLVDDLGLPFFQSLTSAVRQSISESSSADIIEKLEEVGTDPDFARAAALLEDTDKYSVAWRWMLGRNLSAADRNSINVSSLIDDDDSALKAYMSLRIVMRAAGYPMLSILFDELEKVAEISPSTSRNRYFDSLRHLIDRDTKGLCLVLTVTPAGLRIIEDYGTALLRRLVGLGLERLEPFSHENAIRLIGAHLKRNRDPYIEKNPTEQQRLEEVVKTYQNTGHTTDEFIYPFSHDSITAINLMAGSRISDILRLAGVLLQRGLASNKFFGSQEDVSQELTV